MQRWGDRISLVCGLIAAVFLVGMLGLTVADVLLRTLFNYPLRGVFEMIELMLAGSFFFALPCVFLRDDNILVNTIDEYLPRLVPLLVRFALLLAVAAFVVMIWQSWIAARDSYEFHDITADLGLPRTWHWAIVLLGLVGGALAAAFMMIHGADASPPRDASDPMQGGGV